jgi:hypothetical protein
MKESAMLATLKVTLNVGFAETEDVFQVDKDYRSWFLSVDFLDSLLYYLEYLKILLVEDNNLLYSCSFRGSV